jgi:hypothetical protein
LERKASFFLIWGCLILFYPYTTRRLMRAPVSSSLLEVMYRHQKEKIVVANWSCIETNLYFYVFMSSKIHFSRTIKRCYSMTLYVQDLTRYSVHGVKVAESESPTLF